MLFWETTYVAYSSSEIMDALSKRGEESQGPLSLGLVEEQLRSMLRAVLSGQAVIHSIF